MRCSLLQLKCMIVSEDTEYAIISSTMQSMSLITTKDNLLTKRICKTSLDSRPIKIRPGTYIAGVIVRMRFKLPRIWVIVLQT